MPSLTKEQENALNEWLTKEITNALGFSDRVLVSLTSGFVTRDLSQNEIEGQLQEFLGDQTHKVVSNLMQELPKIMQMKRNDKRKQYEELADEEVSKRRRSERESRDDRRRRDRDRYERDRDRRSRDKRYREDERDREKRHKERDRERDREREKEQEKEREREKEREKEKEKEQEEEKIVRAPKSLKIEKKEQKEKLLSVDIKVPQKLSVDNPPKEDEEEETSTPQEVESTAPVPTIDPASINALLQDLQASKQALKQDLIKAQKEQQKQDLLLKTLKRQQIVRGADKEATKEKDIKEKAKRVAGLSESIQERMARLSKLTKPENKEDTSSVPNYMPPPLLLDDKGREVDFKGNIISRHKDSVATLKANQSYRVKQKLADLVVPGAIETTATKKSNKFFDPSLKVKKTDRPKKTFNFLEAGHHIMRAQKLREKAEGTKGEESEEEIEISTRPRDPIPDVEWWDKEVLQNGTYDDIEKDQLKMSNITIYIEHPVPVRPPGTPKKPITLTMFLTKKEMKKLRKRTRMEREKDRQERILLGLEEPPKPKVKISNLMRVLNKEAVQDPTQVEQEVRRQMAERVQNHEARNQARKLDKYERREKTKQKLMRDLEKTGTHVAVFKIKDLSNPKLKFRVDVNAKSLQITGCVILYKDQNLVIAEGGARAIRKYKRILLERVDWNIPFEETKEGDEAENGMDTDEKEITKTSGTNNCWLIWEGINLKPNFNSFRFESVTNEDSIRKYLNRFWSEQYWDMCKNFKEPEGEIQKYLCPSHVKEFCTF